MIAYKGFRPGLICRGYQFVMGLNTTEKANCRENGFHCAEDPLDCPSYYSSLEHSEYYIVNAGGDIDEDEHDSKIACTELTVIKRLTKEELFLHGLAYMVDHPRRVWSSHVAANRAMANCGYAVVRGKDPVATGRLGDILAFAKEAPDSEAIVQVAVANQPDASANRGNGGRGPILWWGRAAHWQFADGVCSVFDSEQKHTEEELVMSFRVLEKEAA